MSCVGKTEHFAQTSGANRCGSNWGLMLSSLGPGTAPMSRAPENWRICSLDWSNHPSRTRDLFREIPKTEEYSALLRFE